MIDRIMLMTGQQRGELEALFYGALGTILTWAERQSAPIGGKTERSRR